MSQSLALIGALIIGVFLSVVTGFMNVNLQGLEAQDLGTKFMGIILAALFIERAVEVMVGIRFGKRENEISGDARAAQAAMQLSNQHVNAELARPVPDNQAAEAMTMAIQVKTTGLNEAKSDLAAKRQVAEDKTTAAVNDKTALGTEIKTYATIASLAFSLAAAVVGFRVFGQFLPTGAAALSGQQLIWFNGFDVAITTLVLSGGAEGLHNTIGQFMSKSDDLTKPK